jgi:hypothetical protein
VEAGAQMHEFAITALAAGGKGDGTKLALFVVLLIVIAFLAAGWSMCASRARAARADQAVGHATPPGGITPPIPPGDL